MSENWRRIAGFRRPISRLILFVTADAEIEIRSGRTVLHRLSISANNSLALDSTNLYPWLPQSFSLFLNSIDPQCQCRIQVEYTEEVTDVLHDGAFLSPDNIPIIDMRLLYGPMGLGIPFALSVSGNPLDYGMIPVQPQSVPYDVVRQVYTSEKPREPPKEEEKPCPGITRLQAFKRELEEEEKPKKKELKRKWWRKPSL